MKIFLLCLGILLTSSLFAQVTVDPTFNPIDVGYGDYYGLRVGTQSSVLPGTAFTQVIQPDGKVLIGGSMSGYNGNVSTNTQNLIRINADGSKDETFNPTGAGANGRVTAITIQADGKILIGGVFTTYNGITVNGICRITSSGGFDPTFNPGLGLGTITSGTEAQLNAIIILSDGKILIVGRFNSYNTVSQNGIARITSNGSLDNTFNVGGSGVGTNYFNYLQTAALQTDGKILIGGAIVTYNGTTKNSIIRINADGTIDAGFNAVDISSGKVETIIIRSDGKLWVGGSIITVNSTGPGVVLLNSNGTRDLSFAPTSGIASNITTVGVLSILLLSNSQLLIGGTFTTFNGISRVGLARINSDGSLDAGFNAGYISNPISINNIQQVAGGGYLFSGYFSNSGSNNSIDKLTSSFRFDSTFNPVNGAKGNINALCRQRPEGKVLIGGTFTAYNGVARNRIARLTVDGDIDLTYNPGSGADSAVNEIVIQSDGKIVIVGTFRNFNATAAARITRTDDTGAIDATFATNIGTGANGAINAVALQTDGKIIIGGNFTFFNGNACNYLARLNANGTFDNTFNIGSGGFGQVRVIRIQTDGKILIGGDFQFFNTSTIGRIARLNADGTIDNTFSSTSTGANGPVYDIQVATDGSIFVAGNFLSYNSTTYRYLVKLTSTGSIVTTFNTQGNIALPLKIQLYADGRVLGIVYNSSIDYKVMRFNANASQDANVPFTAITTPSCLLMIGNGNKFLIGGSFTSVYGIGRNRIARLVDASIAAVPLHLKSFSGNLQNNNALLNWNTANETNTSSFIVQRSLTNSDFVDAATVSAKGSITNSYQFTDFNLSSFNSNILYYRLKIIDKDGSFTYSSIVPIKLNSKTSIALFPNPTKDIAWLQLQNNVQEEKLNITVTDIAGKIMLQQSQTIGIGSTSLPINISILAPATYYIQVISSKRNETLKLIKE